MINFYEHRLETIWWTYWKYTKILEENGFDPDNIIMTCFCCEDYEKHIRIEQTKDKIILKYDNDIFAEYSGLIIIY